MVKIICLGKDFTSEDERREYFRNELREKLPELKKIEGFPIGEDDDIIELSDPPYYTACPNPWLNDFIAEWEKEKESITGRKKEFHVDEPYASDVSEGKNNAIYNAHSYHTKVPHPAIMRYILHYTEPGDIVYDGFAGTGMTGVAAQICEKPDEATKYIIEKEFKSYGFPKPSWGSRKAILCDLSPIATFIAYNFTTHVEVLEFEEKALSILNEIKQEYEWMYKTKHSNGAIGLINYTVWSDVFTCPNCTSEIVFWKVAMSKKDGKVMEEFSCPNCNVLHTKKSVEKTWVTKFDKTLGNSIRQTKVVPVLINYSVGSKRFDKEPDSDDISLINKIDNMSTSYWSPKDELPYGYNTEQPKRSNGITHIHHFYTARTLVILESIYRKCNSEKYLLFILTGILQISSKQSSFRYDSRNPENTAGGILKGTLYIPSISREGSIFQNYSRRLSSIANLVQKHLSFINKKHVLINSASANASTLKENSVDYIFTDPPFGANIMYSELNFIWEAWLKVKTNSTEEAIENKSRNKGFLEYTELIRLSFADYFRVLKPGKWMTVEFSNTSAAIWNGIQNAIQRAGFVIANVAALDKQQGSFKAVTTATAVKQDLVISCYKPSAEFEKKIKAESTSVSVWDFIAEHLHHLPVHISKESSTTAVIERSPKILFDRLITFYLMRGLPIPLDAKDFQEGLKQKFVDRDGMYFTAEQAAEYDEEKTKTNQFVQLSLVVTNESDAIEWLKERLRNKPQKYQDVMPEFRIATQSLRKGDTLPELQKILDENFIQIADGSWRIPDPNEAKDRDALRKKVLLKEFNGYITAIGQPKAKKLKEVRVEALRAGFKNCWEQKDFKTIVTTGDMIPQNILLEDEQLLMYYDIAKDRV